MMILVLEQATKLWDYLRSHCSFKPAELLVVCCSYDLRICDFAVNLLRQGYGRKIIFSGKSGHWTKYIWDEPEAHVFACRAKELRVPDEQISIEDQATNISENILFSKNLAGSARSAIFITKPNTLLRVKLTVPIQWDSVQAFYACPDYEFPNDISNIIGVFGLIHEMVGDIERIHEYPRLGFQVPFELPAEINAIYQDLVAKGFTRHLIKAA